ncbi:hypothetical protein [Streptomyces pseudovenezuelae]|uniref:hypothetical protein n=1 Tax=Streptomyces pseudovenezuelae TaxID=67350 RepID=UPI002E80F303|nr:hypothetical protein [Streptomyces pseudovenezuelae]WUA90121.1 hypothetical protein OHO81_23770 [Streptomyces pseudovenezuelae]
MRRHTSSLRAVLRDLKTDGLVPDVEVPVREVPLVPTHKLYLRRGVGGPIGPYRIVPNAVGSVFMQSWQEWFDSCWHRYDLS